jgi:hypothetical protein
MSGLVTGHQMTDSGIVEYSERNRPISATGTLQQPSELVFLAVLHDFR